MNEIEVKDLYVRHHFGGGVYTKETYVPAGYVLVQHKHLYEHLSVLAKGRAIVSKSAELSRLIEGPTVIVIEAGIHHRVQAVTDCVWLCIHATEATDPKEIDETLIIESSKEEMRAIGGAAV